jgi:hypothetical protein
MMDPFGDYTRYRSLEWYAQELLEEALSDPENAGEALAEVAAARARMMEISQGTA